MYYFNPTDKVCKNIVGAIAQNSILTLHIIETIGGEGDFSADVCRLFLYRDGKNASVYAMNKVEDGFEISIRLPNTGLFFYFFQIGDRFFGKGPLRKGIFDAHPISWQITVFSEDFHTPDWFKGGIMYQIFPDRFARKGSLPIPDGKILRDDWGAIPNYRPNEQGKVLNCDFFGGNLQGVIEKLDYLKSLNVSVIYFNPIFEAYSNHRYDTGDYMKIDSLLGTSEDLNELLKKAESMGIRVILDGVFNHTGDNSRYFNRYGKYDSVGAYQDVNSPYHDWYNFRNFPNNYESWWGITTLPSVNESSKSYQNFIMGDDGVLKKWLSHGIAGYRLDVADELPDFFLEKLRASVKEADEDALIIGEVWEDASNKIAYSVRRKYFQGTELDSVMNYPLKNAIIEFVLSGNIDVLRETIFMLQDNYPKEVLDSLMNILSTHDTSRILTTLGGKICYNKDEMARTFLNDEEKYFAKEKVKLAAFLQYTLPGVPCIYYGDENSMEGYTDPFCRRCYDWTHQDGEMIAYYQMLGRIRREILFEEMSKGEYREIFSSKGVLIFERSTKNESCYCFVNVSDKEYDIVCEGTFKELLSETISEGNRKILPHSYGILKKVC